MYVVNQAKVNVVKPLRYIGKRVRGYTDTDRRTRTHGHGHL